MTRVIFFGTPDPAAKALRRLTEDGYEVVGVYTQPDRKSGRVKTVQPTPVKLAALELGLTVNTPTDLRSEQVLQDLTVASADIFIVLAYGRLLPPEILKIPQGGVVNVHPSLLPLYRGPSPVVSAIRDGASVTGVSVMLVNEGMDTGPILVQSPPVPIKDTDRADQLTDQLFTLGINLMIESISAWQKGEISALPQDDDVATVTRLIAKSDGDLDFEMTAAEIARLIRAYHPWPGTFTRWNGRLLKILEATVLDDTSGPPGVVKIYGGQCLIGTGEGTLRVERLQLEGRGVVAATEFARGYPDIDGTLLRSAD